MAEGFCGYGDSFKFLFLELKRGRGVRLKSRCSQVFFPLCTEISLPITQEERKGGGEGNYLDGL